MQLSRANIKYIEPKAGLTIPDEKLFALPEKVLQFGTGVLLRGLPDYFIDKANRLGIFNGRIMVVKSTASGGTDAFEKQDGLYSLCVRGVENGQKIEETIINSSISRVISAAENWESVLECAANPEMKIIISNTTEVGITLVQDDIRMYPPLSFPGKLLAFLHQRYKIFNGSKETGMVIVPTELIIDNGTKLRSILLELSMMNRLEHGFIEWLKEHNHFCNSLVDRIVPGSLGEADQFNTQKKVGYKDELMIMAETFRFWAIESGSEEVKEALSFAQADEGVVIAADIEKFRELKLRLLNGTHTFSCAVAHLAGFDTVIAAMNDEYLSRFVQDLMIREICPAVINATINSEEAIAFANKTLERFHNPFLEHQWLSITMQYSSKMKMRNLPLLQKHYELHSSVPELMALGFAAFILFMKGKKTAANTYEGYSNGHAYIIKDDNAAWFAQQWEKHGLENVTGALLGDSSFWGLDLTRLPGFKLAVEQHLQDIAANGIMQVIQGIQLNKTTAA
jgi:tagaturonate reductase